VTFRLRTSSRKPHFLSRGERLLAKFMVWMPLVAPVVAGLGSCARPTGPDASSQQPQEIILTDSDLHTVDALNLIQDEAASSGITSTQLVFASRLSGKDMNEVNSRYKDACSWDSGVSGQLALISALSEKSMQEINALYKAAASSGETASQLVMISALFDIPIAEVNQLYHDASSSNEAATNLVLASVISGKEIAEMNQLYREARGSGLGSAELVLAAVHSERSMPGINELDRRLQTDDEARAALILLIELEQRMHPGEQAPILPLLYSHSHGKYSYEHTIYLPFIPK